MGRRGIGDWRKWLPEVGILVVLAILGVGIYSNALQNGFHYDDLHHIVKNPHIRDINNIPSFFTNPETFSLKYKSHLHYRPLVMVSYALNYHFGKLNPAGYHLVNLAFHIGTAFLVFLILQAMLGSRYEVAGGRKAEVRSKKLEVRSKIAFSNFLPLTSNFYTALTAALIFAVHPFNSEVVNYISARSSVMCTFFYLMAFYCWVKYRNQKLEVRGKKSETGNQIISNFLPLTSNFYIASLLAFLLAMLTKEIAITLPVMLFLYDIYFGRKRVKSPDGKRVILHLYVPYLLPLGIGIAYFLVRKLFYGNAVVLSYKDGIYEHFLLEIQVLIKYITMMIFPAGLSVKHYVLGGDSIGNPEIFLSYIILVGVGVLAYWFYKSGRVRLQKVSFFILWFFITHIPTTVVPLTAVLQENRGYLGGVAFLGILAVLIERFTSWAGIRWIKFRSTFFPVTYIIAGIIIFFFSCEVIERNPVWRDDISLYSDVVKKYPESGDAYAALGLAYYDSGNVREALHAYQRAKELGHLTTDFILNLGALSQRIGQLSKAEQLYKIVLEENPREEKAYINLGIIYRKEKKMSLSEEAYRKAIQIEPRSIPAHLGLARTYFEQKKFSLAAQEYQEGLRIDPANLDVRSNLGLVYIWWGKLDLAQKELQKVLEMDPKYEYARTNIDLIEKIKSKKIFLGDSFRHE